MNSESMRRAIVSHIVRSKAIFGPRCLHKAKKALIGGKSGNSSSNYSQEYSSSGDKKSLIGGELSSSTSDGTPNAVRVPKGFLAVYVGPEIRRFVIPASYLSMPELKGLMDRVAEEFGYEQEGGLTIPFCDEHVFEDILARCLARQQIMSKTRKYRNNSTKRSELI